MHEPLMEFEDRELDLRIAEALQRKPDVRVPEDFAAKLAASVPDRALRLRTATVRVRRIGDKVAAVALVVLAVAMLALAPRTAGSTFYLAMEWILIAQFCSLAVWIEITSGD
jgi:hypothetical protein